MAIDYEPFEESEHDVANVPGSYSVSDIPIAIEQHTDGYDRASAGGGRGGRGRGAGSPTHGGMSNDLQRQLRWDLNYHEAAIFLQEGENNDKFTTHPRSQQELPIYLLTHNTWFYILDLLAAVSLMVLTLVEKPAVHPLHLHIAIIGSVELLCLLVIGLELAMRLKWLGPKVFFKHIRSVIKLLTLLIMTAETMAVLVRQAHHFRVTRALRPLLLLDTYYCRGVRRIVRQIIQSLPPVLDMLLSLFFFMLIFSIYGFYLFSAVPNDTYFQSIQQSFTSLFVLLTTANFPDVMLPAYNHSSWSCLFFVVYLCLELYLFMNLLLAVVYNSFSNVEKQKLKKLLLHQREACKHAFKLLVSGQHPNKISLKHFYGLMKYYMPRKSKLDVYLTFKTMNNGASAYLTLEEFYQVKDVCKLKWKPFKSQQLWSSNFMKPFDRAFKGLFVLVSNKYFDYVIYCIITVNFIWVMVDTIKTSVAGSMYKDSLITWHSIMFVTIYVVETLMKLLGLGPSQYFSTGWNRFDFLVTTSAVAGLLLQLVSSNFYYVVILRALRLLRIFKARKRMRDVLGTISILVSQMVSLAVVMILLYFSFAVVGMELFSQYNDMRNCCQNTTVEAYYKYDESTGTGGYYYLNNFNNILKSFVTLFELTVVNNWYIIMEGYTAVSTEWSRLYFMLFYIVTMVVMTVVVAFILDAFLFRIQYSTTMHVEDMDDDAMQRVHVSLVPEELAMCNNPCRTQVPHGRYLKAQTGGTTTPTTPSTPVGAMSSRASPLALAGIAAHNANSAHSSHAENNQDSIPISSNVKWYRGERRLGKIDFGIRMYHDQVQEWIRECNAVSSQQPAELHIIPEINTESSDSS